jgi:hypothetical protein
MLAHRTMPFAFLLEYRRRAGFKRNVVVAVATDARTTG